MEQNKIGTFKSIVIIIVGLVVGGLIAVFGGLGIASFVDIHSNSANVDGKRILLDGVKSDNNNLNFCKDRNARASYDGNEEVCRNAGGRYAYRCLQEDLYYKEYCVIKGIKFYFYEKN